MTKCTKAIIAVAGYGTRRLPVTKTIEKCMLPFGNRPVVDYVVQDCVLAGITDIYFVIGEQSTQIRDYYRTNIDLKDYLMRNGKDHLLPLIEPPKIKFHYVIQPSYGKRGTADAISRVVPRIPKGESVVVLGGDDCIYRSDGQSEIARLIEAAGDQSSILGVHVDSSRLSSYGVLESNQESNFVQIVEKPKLEDAPSDMINISKYVFDYELLKLTEKYVNESQPEGEYYITEPINEYVQRGGQMKIVPAEGEYLDSGTLENWVKGNSWLLDNASAS